jgi:hypothetical protein
MKLKGWINEANFKIITTDQWDDLMDLGKPESLGYNFNITSIKRNHTTKALSYLSN